MNYNGVPDRDKSELILALLHGLSLGVCRGAILCRLLGVVIVFLRILTISLCVHTECQVILGREVRLLRKK
jgi:hypothetical protein